MTSCLDKLEALVNKHGAPILSQDDADELIWVARAAEKVVDAVEKQALNGIPMTPHMRAMAIMLRDALARLEGGE